ncbi:MAG: 4Fe-4S binding protein [Pirellulales bacterium]|nr:4Fe-4S binding protein [Pirellulales bacterium]
MRIAVTATGPSLDGPIDPRFGRCPYFLIVETDDLAFEAVENPNIMLGGGAGIQSAQLMNEKGAKYLMTGNCGPNAYQTLNAAGVEVIVGCTGRVRDVVEQFKLGRLGAAAEPNVVSHFGMGNPMSDTATPPFQQPLATQSAQQPPMTGMGMGRGGGMGMGRGGGRGMGRGGGMGRGMGRGMGGGMSADTWSPASLPASVAGSPSNTSEEQKPKMLKELSQIHGYGKRSSWVATVNAARCTACGACAAVCPMDAITVNAVAHIETANCAGCGVCVDACPQDAITLKSQ